LNREDATGFRDFVKIGKDLLSKGASLCIFPEGTRSVDGKLKPFKKGAFTIATKAKVPVVPVTILGAGDVMPSGHEGELYKGKIKVIVHPPIITRGKKTSEVADECRDAIASRLPAWKLK
jgi:1-acyl-sn-glycerol-3-phosphate acyltransferase